MAQTFSNSSLVVYKKISSHNEGARTKDIDQIAIHYTGGICSVETLGALYARSSNKNSVNYVIGNDGRIALITEEKYTTNTTGSSAVDQRAVTIMVSNSEAKAPWAVSDAAWDAIIDLCTDICRRNGIKKLLWANDASKVNNVAVQNLVAHCLVNPKTACPGKYLLERFGSICTKVNANLQSGDDSIRDTTADNLGGTNADRIWEFLKGKIGNAYGVAGLMGNMYAESGLIPSNLQNSYSKKLGMTDAEYTAAVDMGTYTNFAHDSAGYGLCQWTYWSRKEALEKYCKETKDTSIGSLSSQLEYLWKELNSDYQSVVTALKNASSVKDASDAVLTKFEQPEDQSDKVKNLRASYGEEYYNQYAKGTTGTTIKETITDGVESTLDQFIAFCTSQVGITEYPADSNKVKYNTWYYGSEVSGSSYPWCMAFVQWCFNKFGMALPYKTASCLDLWNWYASKYPSKCHKSNPKVGDIIIFTRSGGGHTGIVTAVSGNTICTVEGNTSPQANEFNANGGAVANKTYNLKNLTNLKGFITAKDFSSTSKSVTITATLVNYKVKITADALYARKGPGKGFTVATVVKKNQQYDICEESIASNGTTWGKIKNTKNWISLHYAVKV